MKFVQVIECRTSRVSDLLGLEDEWEKATEGRRTLRRTIVGRDRNDPERYLVFAFFDSYEDAVANSNLPETDEFARRQAAVLDAPMQFTDLDIVDERS